MNIEDSCPAERTGTDFVRFKWQWLDQVMFDHGLTDAAKVVAYCIIHHLSFETLSAWPSIRRMAALTGLGKATISRGTVNLQLSGYLTIEFSNGGQRRSHIYTPSLNVPPAGQSAGRHASSRDKIRPTSGPNVPLAGPKTSHLSGSKRPTCEDGIRRSEPSDPEPVEPEPAARSQARALPPNVPPAGQSGKKQERGLPADQGARPSPNGHRHPQRVAIPLVPPPRRKRQRADIEQKTREQTHRAVLKALAKGQCTKEYADDLIAKLYQPKGTLQ